ncbi:C2 domain [Carpediemonas membranifera]|uniref:C2 domain n=1 Tax=Carpediemonas membranifera TaxID=201153 RepID=A0A8J6EAN8_9EUKA|nr:C2 domain [Carpediemonas membranifera]|eukprot:KAG9394975.1 C2 domain [Carpediemonas membranifera]
MSASREFTDTFFTLKKPIICGVLKRRTDHRPHRWHSRYISLNSMGIFVYSDDVLMPNNYRDHISLDNIASVRLGYGTDELFQEVANVMTIQACDTSDGTEPPHTIVLQGAPDVIEQWVGAVKYRMALVDGLNRGRILHQVLLEANGLLDSVLTPKAKQVEVYRDSVSPRNLLFVSEACRHKADRLAWTPLTIDGDYLEDTIVARIVAWEDYSTPVEVGVATFLPGALKVADTTVPVVPSTNLRCPTSLRVDATHKVIVVPTAPRAFRLDASLVAPTVFAVKGVFFALVYNGQEVVRSPPLHDSAQFEPVPVDRDVIADEFAPLEVVLYKFNGDIIVELDSATTSFYTLTHCPMPFVGLKDAQGRDLALTLSPRPMSAAADASTGEIRCSFIFKGLPRMDSITEGGRADPYLLIYSNPTTPHADGDVLIHMTEVRPNTLSPDFRDIPLPVEACGGVNGSITVKVLDFDNLDCPDEICTFSLAMSQVSAGLVLAPRKADSSQGAGTVAVEQGRMVANPLLDSAMSATGVPDHSKVRVTWSRLPKIFGQKYNRVRVAVKARPVSVDGQTKSPDLVLIQSVLATEGVPVELELDAASCGGTDSMLLLEVLGEAGDAVAVVGQYWTTYRVLLSCLVNKEVYMYGRASKEAARVHLNLQTTTELVKEALAASKPTVSLTVDEMAAVSEDPQLPQARAARFKAIPVLVGTGGAIAVATTANGVLSSFSPFKPADGLQVFEIETEISERFGRYGPLTVSVVSDTTGTVGSTVMAPSSIPTTAVPLELPLLSRGHVVGFIKLCDLDYLPSAPSLEAVGIQLDFTSPPTDCTLSCETGGRAASWDSLVDGTVLATLPHAGETYEWKLVNCDGAAIAQATMSPLELLSRQTAAFTGPGLTLNCTAVRTEGALPQPSPVSVSCPGVDVVLWSCGGSVVWATSGAMATFPRLAGLLPEDTVTAEGYTDGVLVGTATCSVNDIFLLRKGITLRAACPPRRTVTQGTAVVTVQSTRVVGRIQLEPCDTGTEVPVPEFVRVAVDSPHHFLAVSSDGQIFTTAVGGDRSIKVDCGAVLELFSVDPHGLHDRLASFPISAAVTVAGDWAIKANGVTVTVSPAHAADPIPAAIRLKATFLDTNPESPLFVVGQTQLTSILEQQRPAFTTPMFVSSEGVVSLPTAGPVSVDVSGRGSVIMTPGMAVVGSLHPLCHAADGVSTLVGYAEVTETLPAQEQVAAARHILIGVSGVDADYYLRVHTMLGAAFAPVAVTKPCAGLQQRVLLPRVTTDTGLRIDLLNQRHELLGSALTSVRLGTGAVESDGTVVGTVTITEDDAGVEPLDPNPVYLSIALKEKRPSGGLRLYSGETLLSRMSGYDWPRIPLYCGPTEVLAIVVDDGHGDETRVETSMFELNAMVGRSVMFGQVTLEVAPNTDRQLTVPQRSLVTVHVDGLPSTDGPMGLCDPFLELTTDVEGVSVPIQTTPFAPNTLAAKFALVLDAKHCGGAHRELTLTVRDWDSDGLTAKVAAAPLSYNSLTMLHLEQPLSRLDEHRGTVRPTSVMPLSSQQGIVAGDSVRLSLACSGLDAKDVTGFSDPYLVISSSPYRSTTTAVEPMTMIYRSEIHRRTLSPTFKEFVLPLTATGGLAGTVRVDVFDHNDVGAASFIGSATVPMARLCSAGFHIPLINSVKRNRMLYRNSGMLMVRSVLAVDRPMRVPAQSVRVILRVSGHPKLIPHPFLRFRGHCVDPRAAFTFTVDPECTHRVGQGLVLPLPSDRLVAITMRDTELLSTPVYDDGKFAVKLSQAMVGGYYRAFAIELWNSGGTGETKLGELTTSLAEFSASLSHNARQSLRFGGGLKLHVVTIEEMTGFGGPLTGVELAVDIYAASTDDFDDMTRSELSLVVSGTPSPIKGVREAAGWSLRIDLTDQPLHAEARLRLTCGGEVFGETMPRGLYGMVLSTGHPLHMDMRSHREGTAPGMRALIIQQAIYH